MRSLLVVALVACAPHPTNVPVDPMPNLAPLVSKPAPAPVPALPTAPDDATILANSHAFFEALDRFDDAAALARVAPGFMWLQDQRFMDAKVLASRAQADRDHHAPVRTETWSRERVFAGPSAITFFGHAIQHLPADSEHGALDRDAWLTAVWVPVGAEWKLAIVQWERGGIDAEKARWNETFRIATIFKREPNQLLVDTVKGVKPGAALDIDMGQGRNAIYLASQGWKVTGVDISDEGIRMAKAEAAKRKLKLETIEADVNAWDPGTNKWDLVTMIYAGDKPELVRHLQPSVKKGGLFVLEYFHIDSDMAAFGAGGWQTGALAKLFEGWEIVRDDVVDDVSDWGLTKRKLVRFVARKTTATPTLADCAWIAGTWHAAALDAHWQLVDGALWGIALDAQGGFEVNYIDDSDDDGKPAPISLVSIGNGKDLSRFALRSASPSVLDFGDVRVTKTASGWRGAFTPPGKPQVAFDMQHGQLAGGKPLADADLAFAADTAAHGADGWSRWFAPEGAMWRGNARIEGAAIHDAIGKTLARGLLKWKPLASGVRGDLGFTLGTYTFLDHHGSYATIWKKQPDGSWKVLFDAGRPG